MYQFGDNSPITSPGTVVTNPGCEVMFQSTDYGWGLGYATFQYAVLELPVRPANWSFPEVRATVTVDVTFSKTLPVLCGPTHTTLLEESAGVSFQISSSDPDGVSDGERAGLSLPGRVLGGVGRK